MSCEKNVYGKALKRYPSEVKSSQFERICTPNTAKIFRKEGWASADLHVHTCFSYDVIPTRSVDPLHLYEKSLAKGLRFIAFTDHDNMDAYDAIGWTREGLVPSVEIKLLDPVRIGHTIHVNIFQLSKNQFREIRRISSMGQNIEIFIEYLRSEKLHFSYNHPFWHEAGENLSVKAVFDIAPLFPVLEYNRGRIPLLNQQAILLSDFTGAGLIASTDTHIGEIGECFTLARGNSFDEFFRNIIERRSFLVTQDLNIGLLKKETQFRLRQFADDRKWVFKKQFRIDTGISILDGLIERLTCPEGLMDRWVKKSILPIMHLISRSGIPANLYLRSQHDLARKIAETVTQYAPSLTSPAA